MDLALHVAEFFRGWTLPGAAGVVAVSGGPDSVALAHALFRLRQQDILGKLVIAHVNHQLRGAESDADQAFVAGLLGQWWSQEPALLHFRTQSFDTGTVAELCGENVEALAREERYEWLAQVAREEDADWVAVGHTADDQAETVLFRLLRGSGLDGLRGMSPRRPLSGVVELLRPMLALRRQDVLDYLQREGLPFREDSSNRDPKFTRNRIRHELIPQLRRDYNPALVAVLCRLAEQAREAQAEMRPMAQSLLAAAELPRAGDTLVFRAAVLAEATPHRLREMFRLVWEREGWPAGPMGFDHWQRLVSVVHSERPAWDLPGGVRVRSAGAVVQVGVASRVWDSEETAP